jgi:hypothetical protein
MIQNFRLKAVSGRFLVKFDPLKDRVHYCYDRNGGGSTTTSITGSMSIVGVWRIVRVISGEYKYIF